MKVTIDFDEKKLINDVVQNFPEYAISMQCTRYDYDKCIYSFIDHEDGGKKYTVTFAKFKKGLKIMLKLLTSGQLKGVANYVMPDFQDAGNWDGTAVDCLLQCAIFGEIIYG